MKQVRIWPLKNPVTKTIEIPGSKSYTNRALLMAALTENSVTIENPLFSDDTKAMIDCLNQLGIKTEATKDSIIVQGSITDVKEEEYALNADLAATVIRFLLPLLCVVPGTKILTGKEGLNKRPIGELVNGLRQLGAEITYLEKEGFPPLKITSSKLQSKTIHLKGDVSSQFFSALFMIAPIIGGLTIQVEGKQISKPYIDMTIDTMKNFGITVENKNYETYHISAGQKYTCETYAVEGDFSSAGYFFAIAALTKSTFTLKNLNPDSLQADKKLLPVLEQMGNEITCGTNEITIVGKAIKPITLDMIDFPDQAQTLAVLLAFAPEKSVLTGLESLHVKETDRLKATVNELERMCVETESTYDTLTIHGGGTAPSHVETYGDQRMAMAFAIAGAVIPPMVIKNADVVNKTFPEFWDKLKEIGIGVEDVTNIILIGMRGSGKSTIGKMLAKKIDITFIDMDTLLAEKVNMSLPEFVKKYGWEKFRDKESEVIEKTQNLSNAVIATGGGAIIRKENIDALKKNGKFIYLETSIETMIKRIGKGKNRPPLTKEKTLEEELNHVLHERKNLYEQTADTIVKTDNKTVKQIVDEIVNLL